VVWDFNRDFFITAKAQREILAKLAEGDSREEQEEILLNAYALRISRIARRGFSRRGAEITENYMSP
jgi:hypothetical protein